MVVLAGVVVVAALAGGVALLRHHQRANPLANLPHGVYQPAQPIPGDTLPLPQAPPRRQ
jgi:hypothetical protein